jgi:GGDEF domain-containing protein
MIHRGRLLAGVCLAGATAWWSLPGAVLALLAAWCLAGRTDRDLALALVRGDGLTDADPAWSEAQRHWHGLHRHLRHLQGSARLDPSTGTWRRWYGEHRLEDLPGVALVLLDLDGFKTINDRDGHAAGDAVLARVGAGLNHGMRSGDLVCRWGGNAFLLILPRTDAAGALAVARRVRDVVASATPITATVATAVRGQAEPTAALLHRIASELDRMRAGRGA